MVAGGNVPGVAGAIVVVPGAIVVVVLGAVQAGAVVGGGLATRPPSTGVGNCTRCAQTVGATNKQHAASTPRNVQAVESVVGFTLGTECFRRDSAGATGFKRALNISPAPAGQGQVVGDRHCGEIISPKRRIIEGC